MPAPAPSALGSTPDPGLLAEAVAARVRRHPAVAALDSGPFGTLATHLPGRRVPGVLVEQDGAVVRLGIVVRLGHPVPSVAAELRQWVRVLAGRVAVHVTVTDLSTGPEPDTGADDDAGAVEGPR